MQLYFNVYSSSPTGTSNKCIAYLKNAVGTLIETREINFNTTTKVTTSNQDPTVQNTTSGESIVNDAQTKHSPTCGEMCTSWYSILCFIANVNELFINSIELRDPNNNLFGDIRRSSWRTHISLLLYLYCEKHDS